MPTPNLELTPLAAAQSQKHVTVNEAFARLDAATQLSVLDRTRTQPPPSPANGDRHIVAPNAQGDWTARVGQIVAWDSAAQGWLFLDPREGWRVWCVAERLLLVHEGGTWRSLAPGQLGINATPDDTNRLAVASDAVLFTHDGDSIRAGLNKASDTDTASVVFQSDYTGHAEIGLTGGKDFHFKTSPDGGTFTDAIILDADTARADFPAGASAAGLSLGPDLAPNMLPDQGRFAGSAVSDSHTAPTFELPAYLTDFNGSTLESYPGFIHNNSTYGLGNDPLDPEVDSLISLLRPPNRRDLGVEWWSLKITQGNGTSGTATVGGVDRPIALRSNTAPMPRAYTMGLYIRALSGSAFIDHNLTSRFARWGVDETGNVAAGVVTPADGWVFIERQMTYNNFGYSLFTFQIHIESEGDEALIAMPRVVFGHMALDPYLPGPLPNARCFG